MPRIRVSPEASNDIDEIWKYIARDSIEAAEREIDRIEAAVRHLADWPGRGHFRPDIDPDMLAYSVGHYLILYFRIPDGIEVVHVVHGAREMRKIFPPD